MPMVESEFSDALASQRAEPSASLLASCIACLSGGRDLKGLPIIVFPAKAHLQFNMNMTALNNILMSVKYYLSITHVEMRMHGFAFLVDFRSSSFPVFEVIISALDQLHNEIAGSVAVLYLLVPQNKRINKLVRKHLGLTKNKKGIFRRSSPAKEVARKAFKVTLIANMTEVNQFIAPNQLTADFGGTMGYNHDSWINLQKDLNDLLFQVNDVSKKIPQTQERMQHLQSMTDSLVRCEETQETLQEMQIIFVEVLEELDLDSTMKNLSNFHETCCSNEVATSFANNPHLNVWITRAQDLQDKLKEIRQYFQQKWHTCENRMQRQSKLASLIAQSEEVKGWFEQQFYPQFCEIKAQANRLSDVEEADKDLKDLLLVHAESWFSKGREIINSMEELSKYFSEDELIDPKSYSAQLKRFLDRLRKKIEEKFRQLNDLSQFFILCDKLIRWYRKTLQFLPTHLLNHSNSDQILITSDWINVVQPYLAKNPLPNVTQLKTIKQTFPLIKDVRIQDQAQLLLYRLEVLGELLVDRNIKSKKYREILDWKLKESRSFSADVYNINQQTGETEHVANNHSNSRLETVSTNSSIEPSMKISPRTHYLKHNPQLKSRNNSQTNSDTSKVFSSRRDTDARNRMANSYVIHSPQLLEQKTKARSTNGSQSRRAIVSQIEQRSASQTDLLNSDFQTIEYDNNFLLRKREDPTETWVNSHWQQATMSKVPQKYEIATMNQKRSQSLGTLHSSISSVDHDLYNWRQSQEQLLQAEYINAEMKRRQALILEAEAHVNVDVNVEEESEKLEQKAQRNHNPHSQLPATMFRPQLPLKKYQHELVRKERISEPIVSVRQSVEQNSDSGLPNSDIYLEQVLHDLADMMTDASRTKSIDFNNDEVSTFKSHGNKSRYSDNVFFTSNVYSGMPESLDYQSAIGQLDDAIKNFDTISLDDEPIHSGNNFLPLSSTTSSGIQMPVKRYSRDTPVSLRRIPTREFEKNLRFKKISSPQLQNKNILSHINMDNNENFLY